MVVDLLKVIENIPNTLIKSAQLVAHDRDVLAINSRNGNIYTQFSPFQLNLGKNYKNIVGTLAMQFTYSPLNFVLDSDYTTD